MSPATVNLVQPALLVTCIHVCNSVSKVLKILKDAASATGCSNRCYSLAATARFVITMGELHS